MKILCASLNGTMGAYPCAVDTDIFMTLFQQSFIYVSNMPHYIIQIYMKNTHTYLQIKYQPYLGATENCIFLLSRDCVFTYLCL